MRLVEQWREIERGLPAAWSDASLALNVGDAGRADLAASLLGPLAPGRQGSRFRLTASRRGVPSTGAVARALGNLDEEGIGGRLELVGAEEVAAPPPVERPALATAWDAELAALPGDWSHLLGEVELASTDHLERAALQLSPLNPARVRDAVAFRFRCARAAGYGASPGMVGRCLERLDEQGIRASVRVLRAVTGTDAIGTQGPVWYVAGRAV